MIRNYKIYVEIWRSREDNVRKGSRWPFLCIRNKRQFLILQILLYCNHWLILNVLKAWVCHSPNNTFVRLALNIIIHVTTDNPGFPGLFCYGFDDFPLETCWTTCYSGWSVMTPPPTHSSHTVPPREYWIIYWRPGFLAMHENTKTGHHLIRWTSLVDPGEYWMILSRTRPSRRGTIWLLPQPPSPALPSASCLSFSVLLCVAYWRERERGRCGRIIPRWERDCFTTNHLILSGIHQTGPPYLMISCGGSFRRTL